MLGGLRGRVVLLAVLIALLATGLCAVAAGQVMLGRISAMESTQIGQVDAELRQRLLSRLLGLHRMLTQLLARSVPEGGLSLSGGELANLPIAEVDALVLADASLRPRTVLSNRPRDMPGASSEADERRAAESWLRRPQAALGVGLVGGRLALIASARLSDLPPSMRDHSGGAACVVGLRYVDETFLEALTLTGWRASLVLERTGQMGSLTKPLSLGAASVQLRADEVTLDVPLDLPGGSAHIQLSSDRQQARTLLRQATLAMLVAGLASLLISAPLGALLGWRWLRPIMGLAQQARQRAAGSQAELVPDEPLHEAVELARAFNQTLIAEQRHEADLRDALERELRSAEAQRRFLEHLAGDIDVPVKGVLAAADALRTHSRAHAPAQGDDALALLERSALRLEARMQELRGLVAGLGRPSASEGSSSTLPPVASTASAGSASTITRMVWVDDFLNETADLLRLRLGQQSVQLTTDAAHLPLGLDPAKLGPALVGLVMLASTAKGVRTVVLGGELREDGSLGIEVRDDGGERDPAALDLLRSAAAGQIALDASGNTAALAQSLADVTAMDGRIGLAETPRGCTVVLRFPRAKHVATSRIARREG